MAEFGLGSTAAGGFVTALSQGNLEVALGILAVTGGSAAGKYGLSKLFRTDMGRQFLTEGVNIAKPVESFIKGKAPATGRAAEIASPLEELNEATSE